MPTHYKGTPKQTLALNTFIKLTRGTNSLLARLAQRNTHESLTVSQFGVLEALYHLGPMCQSELGSKMLMSGGNITMIVDNLEKRGLVQRQRDEQDRRFIIVTLTDEGEALIAEVFPVHLDAIVDELSVLSTEEQEDLGRLCRKMGLGSTS